MDKLPTGAKLVAINAQGDKINPQTGTQILNKTTPPKSYSKYEVKPTDTFKLEFGLLPQENRIIVVNQDIMNKQIENHYVIFKMWTYKQELEWKSSSTTFDLTQKIHVLDSDKYNEFKIRNLLSEWSFTEFDENLKLLHINGYLVDESYVKFTNLYPNVIQHIINQMNGILEFNG